MVIQDSLFESYSIISLLPTFKNDFPHREIDLEDLVLCYGSDNCVSNFIITPNTTNNDTCLG